MKLTTGYKKPAENTNILLASGADIPQSTFATAGHTHQYLALSGGTMTGALTTTALTVTGAATFSQAINGNILGNAATASRLQNARTISLTGSVTGSVAFDGSGNVSLATTTNHTHLYAGSSIAGGAANSALYANKVYGIYTGNGGQQGPSYYGKNYAGFLMSNATVNSNSNYKNWLYMDCYNGNDVGGATALGLDRTEPRAFIMQSTATRSSWNNTAEILTGYNLSQYIGYYAGYCGVQDNAFHINTSGAFNVMFAWHVEIHKPSYPVIIYSKHTVDCRCASLIFKLLYNGDGIPGTKNIDIGFALYDSTYHTLSNQVMFSFYNNQVHCKIGNTISGIWNLDGDETFKIEIINGVAYFYRQGGLELLYTAVVNSSIYRNIVGYFTAPVPIDIDEISYTHTTINQYTSLLGGVAISNPTNGQVLKFNGTHWVNGTDNTGSGGGSTVSLPEGDITLSTTAQTYITADSVARKIKLPTTCPWTVGSTTLSGLTDTTISSPSNGQYLKYNGSKWINSAGPSTPSEATSWADSTGSLGLVSPTFTDSARPETYVPHTDYIAFPVMQTAEGHLWVALPKNVTDLFDLAGWEMA